MFTGIIETLGKVISLEKKDNNLHITVSSNISPQLKIDQSVAHNGVCLTVIALNKSEKTHTVTAVQETLTKSNLQFLKIGNIINLERSLQLGDRLDGHIVQGHVDSIATCKKIEEQNGSYKFTFTYPQSIKQVTVEKGSVCINGISLTVVDSKAYEFSVVIIPYTYEHTNVKTIKVGDKVNVEFDILGKYIAKLIQH